jgi:hypothetical protein
MITFVHVSLDFLGEESKFLVTMTINLQTQIFYVTWQTLEDFFIQLDVATILGGGGELTNVLRILVYSLHFFILGA